MRGTVAKWTAHFDQKRFIPARAGNGPNIAMLLDSAPVHPRACGERAGNVIVLAANDGSSPRVRGTGAHGVEEFDDRRFIPARAGNGFR